MKKMVLEVKGSSTPETVVSAVLKGQKASGELRFEVNEQGKTQEVSGAQVAFVPSIGETFVKRVSAGNEYVELSALNGSAGVISDVSAGGRR